MPVMDRHRRLTRHAALAAALSLLVMVALAGTAAAAVPVFRSSFTCSVATPCGSVTSMDAGRLAVNEATGDVYVLDATADAILVFDSDGTYLSQISPSATTAGTFELGAEADIAVDNSSGSNAGNIYVNSENASINGNASTFAFDPTGTFLWEAGGFTDECGIGVDPANGNLYAMDLNSGFQQLDPADGSAIGSPVVFVSAVPPCHFEIDSTGTVIAAQFNGRVDAYNPADGSRIHRFASPDVHLDVAVDRSNDDVYSPTDGHGTEKFVTTGALDPASPFGPAGFGAAVNSTNSSLYVSVGTEVQIFEPVGTFTLTAATDGTGSGSVSADSGAIADCSASGGTCSDSYADGTTVTLSPSADTGSSFAGWTGCDDVTGDLCTITVNGDKNVTATFDAVSRHRLTVSKTGTGSGTVTSSPTGINCGATCDALFDDGTQVTLTATPAAGSTFAGWSGGGCAGTGTCRVTLGGDTTVTAQFAQSRPAVVTGAASSITQTGASIAGTVNPNGSNVTDCHVEYGTTTSYGSQVACASLPGSGTSAVGVSATLSGLTAGTTYHYRVVATNGAGATNGSDQTFATSPVPSCATDASLCPPPPPRTCATDPSLCPKPGVLALDATTAAVRAGKAAIKLSCNGETACTGKITLTARVKVRRGGRTVVKTQTIGTANVDIAAGGSATVKVSLSRAARSVLAKRHSLKATLSGPGLVKKTLVLKQPPARRRHKR
jgi:hypothetical protein